MNGPKEEGEGMEALAQETTSYYGWLNILCYNVSRNGMVCISSEALTTVGRIPQRTPRLPFGTMDQPAQTPRGRQGVLRTPPFSQIVAIRHIQIHHRPKCRYVVPRQT